MSIDIGRVTLQRVRRLRPNRQKETGAATGTTGQVRPVEQSRREEVIELVGDEVGSNADTTVQDLRDEVLRVGDVFVEEANTLIRTGYYKLVTAGSTTQHPNHREWTATLHEVVEPIVTRQAEDDNTSGTDTDDVDAEEGTYVSVSTTATEDLILDPRNVTGAENLDLPLGTYRVLARVQAEDQGDISTASLNQSFDVSTEDTLPQDVFLRSDGLKMYVIGNSSDDIHEYDLSTAWDISSASLNQSFDVSTEETRPRGVFFRDDGLKMYVVGDSSDDVHEYDLSTAWDVSTASFSQSLDVSTEETFPQDVFLRSDGLKMYVIGSDSDDVHEYDLSTAWDISSASLNQSFDVSGEDTDPTGVFFRSDGLKMYVIGHSSDDVHEYDLSTAWDISSASLNQSFDVSGEDTTPTGVFFRDDGLKMYVVGLQNDNVYEYDLSTAKIRAKTTQTDGTVITSGDQVDTDTHEWRDYDLGDFEIGQSDEDANWYEVHVQGASSGNTVRVDRVRFVPV